MARDACERISSSGELLEVLYLSIRNGPFGKYAERLGLQYLRLFAQFALLHAARERDFDVRDDAARVLAITPRLHPPRQRSLAAEFHPRVLVFVGLWDDAAR